MKGEMSEEPTKKDYKGLSAGEEHKSDMILDTFRRHKNSALAIH